MVLLFGGAACCGLRSRRGVSFGFQLGVEAAVKLLVSGYLLWCVWSETVCLHFPCILVHLRVFEALRGLPTRSPAWHPNLRKARRKARFMLRRASPGLSWPVLDTAQVARSRSLGHHHGSQVSAPCRSMSGWTCPPCFVQCGEWRRKCTTSPCRAVRPDATTPATYQPRSGRGDHEHSGEVPTVSGARRQDDSAAGTVRSVSTRFDDVVSSPIIPALFNAPFFLISVASRIDSVCRLCCRLGWTSIFSLFGQLSLVAGSHSFFPQSHLCLGRRSLSLETRYRLACVQAWGPLCHLRNYRPISLASCFFKLLEHLVHSRISPRISPQLDESQGGFRKGADFLDLVNPFLLSHFRRLH